jgi:hypothetical protein
MAGNFSTAADLRIVDPVATTIVHGYANADAIAPFLAPVVPVSTRAGYTVKFTKENFAVLDLSRAPKSNVKRISANFDREPYALQQHAVGSEVPREVYEEALNGPARINLRAQSLKRASVALEQHWENRVISTIYNTANFETSNVLTIAGSIASYDATIQNAAELIRAQVGVYPNSAVISPDVYRFIRANAEYKDRIKYTSSKTVNEQAISAWWDLTRGVKVARRQKLNSSTGQLESMVPAGTILLFYNPEGGIGTGFTPTNEADAAVPAMAYTYALDGYPLAEEERFDFETKTFITDIIAEQTIQTVGLGATGKCGAGLLIRAITG